MVAVYGDSGGIYSTTCFWSLSIWQIFLVSTDEIFPLVIYLFDCSYFMLLKNSPPLEVVSRYRDPQLPSGWKLLTVNGIQY